MPAYSGMCCGDGTPCPSATTRWHTHACLHLCRVQCHHGVLQTYVFVNLLCCHTCLSCPSLVEAWACLFALLPYPGTAMCLPIYTPAVSQHHHVAAYLMSQCHHMLMCTNPFACLQCPSAFGTGTHTCLHLCHLATSHGNISRLFARLLCPNATTW